MCYSYLNNKTSSNTINVIEICIGFLQLHDITSKKKPQRSHLHTNFSIFFSALMKLSRPVKFAGNSRIRAVCLPTHRLSHNQTDLCVATGWGRDVQDGELAVKLLEARVPVHDNAICRKKYGRSVPIRSGHLCAGHLDGSTGTCVVSSHFFLWHNFGDFLAWEMHVGNEM